VSAPAFVVGIDLGTTHSALAYVEADAPAGERAPVRVLEVGQLVARNVVEPRQLLPSFLYVAHASEGPQALPWDDKRAYAVGEYARARAAEAPGRVVASAKSWLCHPTLDRRAGLLPAGQAAEDVEKISPVEASFRYLEHLAEAWDATVAKGNEMLALRNQDVVLTVPASFDAGARELTAEAAVCAGLERFTLLEEPQAAFYAWLDGTGGGWRKQLKPGDVVLVVDVGGGTTDFSAIAARDEGGNLELYRVAVGDHILLGGDNMDLALAYAVRQRLRAEGKELDAWQMNALVHGCRGAKEALLGGEAASAPIVIPGRGSKLLGGALRAELGRDELERVLVDGFFPKVGAEARPVQRPRTALTQVGLPYAADAGITRHLAAFLGRQAGAAGGGGAMLRPTALLFNGGVMKGTPLRTRLLEVLAAWFGEAGGPRVLEGADYDLSVARGAAVYGLARLRGGVRVRGGTARAYYVGIEGAMPAVPGIEPPLTALCVAPFGMEEGTVASLPDEEFGLVVGEPVRFRFFGSTTRRGDHAGTALEVEPGSDLEELPPIEITLPAEGRSPGEVVPVSLRSAVTEVGTLSLEALPRDRKGKPDERWKVELSVRAEGGTSPLARREKRTTVPTSSSPLLVGIDLGTTHSVVAFAERREGARPELLPLPQLVSGAEIEARPLLPSFLYAPTAEEAARLPDDPGLYDPPWLAGEHARRRAAEAPERSIASAKSWLCHRGVDRHAPILPWVGRGGRDEALPSLSPVEASARLLWHLRRAWDAAHPGRPLGEQEVVLTIPASFDETARELTVEAARDAGIAPRLLEEPQAAFYDFMARTSPDDLRALAGGPGGEGLVLVCDVGGGTTDLSLLRLRASGSDVEIERVAVGDHLLLGGDNMDLALAHRCEPAIAGGAGGLDALRFGRLVAACRAAKERLLSEGAPDEATVTVLGSGGGLVGGARSAKLARADVEALVLDGFFPDVGPDDRPGAARGALVAFGLPYARDTALTRHMAAFLARHGVRKGPLALLPNGGVFHAARLVERLESVLASWIGTPVRRLHNDAPDVAVARGAVAFALARAGFGRRITGGSARAYYVGVGAGEGERALCVVPRGAEPGTTFEAPQRFALKVGSPSRFPLFASRGAEVHRPGELVEPDDERFDRLPALSTVLPGAGGAELPVVVRGELSEVGTLELVCVEAEPQPGAEPRRFGLSFGLREGAGPKAAPAPRPPPVGSFRNFDEASALLGRVFGKKGQAASPREVKDLTRELERLLGERAGWSTALARSLADQLLPNAKSRKRSPDHERAFWSLAGYCLRPGFGAEGDADRIARLAPLFAEGVTHARDARVWQQAWVAWRRVAGGLDEATQGAIRDYADPFLLAHLGAGKKPKGTPPEALDDLLALASFLERVAPARKASLGRAVLERTYTRRDMRLWEALGRLGARVPAYASAHFVVPPAAVEEWVDQLLREPWAELPGVSTHATRLARRTGDRARDLAERVRQSLVRRMQASGAPEADLRAVREVVALDAAERALSFGESLPVGLRLEAPK
jgi:molecular chaperone DnaK (HSP70)